jgi:hypothetical protein
VEGDEGIRFLPPEPPGPEPELSGRRAKEPPPPPPQQPQPQQPQQPQHTYGYQPPPPGYGQPPPPAQGYGYQPPPPGYGYGQPAPWGYQPPAPDNGQAVAGFVFSLVAVGLLVISFGLSTIVSLGCAITGIVLSRKGKRKVDSGQTPKHRGLAQAGFIVGWVGVGLSLLAIAGWIAAFAISAGDESFNLDPDQTREVVALTVWR